MRQDNSMKQRSKVSALILILTGCATPAPAVQHYSPDWKTQTLYSKGADGSVLATPMSKAPPMVCEPPDQEAAYIKYCRSKGR